MIHRKFKSYNLGWQLCSVSVQTFNFQLGKWLPPFPPVFWTLQIFLNLHKRFAYFFRDRLQISLLILSKLINLDSPSTHQRTYRFLMISGEIEGYIQLIISEI